jgi:enoyl-CoA hydratase/carnithine racemase
MSDVSHNSSYSRDVPLTSHVHVRLRNNWLWLLLDHQSQNTLTTGMLEQITALLQRSMQQTPPPALVILTSTEDTFCEGVYAHDTLGEHVAPLQRAATATCSTLGELRTRQIPAVALVKGVAFGVGCELLALCDAVIAREDAQFRLPAPNEHIFPCSVPIYLPAALGQETVTRLSEEQKTLSAREAMQLGLVHQVLPTSRFHADAEELLVMLASLSGKEKPLFNPTPSSSPD